MLGLLNIEGFLDFLLRFKVTCLRVLDQPYDNLRNPVDSSRSPIRIMESKLH